MNKLGKRNKDTVGRKVWSGFFILLLVSIIGAGYYAMEIEPKSLSIIRLDVVNPSIPSSFSGIHIVQFSDTHLGPHYSVEQLQIVVNRIQLMHPDIVVFTGDLIDQYTQFGAANRTKAQDVLKKIKAPLGKFAVYGNHDRGGGGSQRYKRYMEEAGFTVLVNEVHTIQSKNGDNINIAGFDDFLLGKPQIKRTLQSLKAEDFNILLVHEPDITEQIKNYPIDLQLSGHSHGGQVKLPFLAPPVTTRLAHTYVEGLYSLSRKREPSMLYVNRGIGTTRMPFRLFAKPELTYIQLLHAKDGLDLEEK